MIDEKTKHLLLRTRKSFRTGNVSIFHFHKDTISISSVRNRGNGVESGLKYNVTVPQIQASSALQNVSCNS